MFEKKEVRWNIEEGIKDELRNWEGKEIERKGERRARKEECDKLVIRADNNMTIGNR